MKEPIKIHTRKTVYAIISSVIFLIIISLPLSNSFFNFSKKQEISRSENRKLASEPEIDINKLDPFPVAYETFFNDHFIFREELLKLNTYIHFFWFKQSPIPEKVALGKDSWLFFKDKERSVYDGTFQLSNSDIDKIINELNYRDSLLREGNIPFIILIAPIKAEVYSELLPSYYRRSSNTVTQEIVRRIKIETKIPVIYPKESLINAKKTFQTYHQFDNHWNQAGAFIAYMELMQAIKKHFPNIKTNELSLKDVLLTKEVAKGGNLANMIALDHLLNETNYSYKIQNKSSTDAQKQNYQPIPGFAYPQEYEMVFETKDTNLSKALIIRDSYANAMMPYLSESFSRTCFIFDAWQYKLNEEIIKSESPDIVILEIFEPHISNILDYLKKTD